MARNPALGIQIVSFLLLLGFSSMATAFASGSKQVRILPFPTNYSVGTLGLLEEDPGSTSKGKVVPIGEAKGIVKVPKNNLVKMQPGVQFYQHPECLLKLPPDGIDYIKLRYTAMTDADEKISDRLIPYLHHLSGLKGIDMDQSETTDVGLAKLGTMPELRALALSETMVTGKCLPQLIGCKKLESIRFGKVQIDNDSLRYLKEFPQLSGVDVARTNLSLVGLENICQCKKLEVLDINENSAIDDRAVLMLAKLSKLRNLHFKGTKISFDGVIQLSKFGLKKVSLPKSFQNYTRRQQEQIVEAYPGIKFKASHHGVDSYTKTMFGPLSR